MVVGRPSTRHTASRTRAIASSSSTPASNSNARRGGHYGLTALLLKVKMLSARGFEIVFQQRGQIGTNNSVFLIPRPSLRSSKMFSSSVYHLAAAASSRLASEFNQGTAAEISI